MFHTFVSVVGFSMCFFDACLRTRAVLSLATEGLPSGREEKGNASRKRSKL